MYILQVQEVIVKVIQFAQFIACSCDNVIAIEWICVSFYMVESWIKVLILCFVEWIVDGWSFNNLIKVIMATLWRVEAWLNRICQKKVAGFWCNGAFLVQVQETWITRQIKKSWTSFSMNVHCVVHKINLIVQYCLIWFS